MVFGLNHRGRNVQDQTQRHESLIPDAAFLIDDTFADELHGISEVLLEELLTRLSYHAQEDKSSLSVLPG